MSYFREQLKRPAVWTAFGIGLILGYFLWPWVLEQSLPVSIEDLIAAIDWIAVSAQFVATSLTLVVAVIGIYIRHKLIQKREAQKAADEQRRRQELELKLAKLGEARGEAIRIRNDGEKQNLSGARLFSWLRLMIRAERAMIAAGYDISPADGNIIDYQDRPPGLAYRHINDAGQARGLRNLSGAIIRVEIVLNKYRLW